MVYGLDTDKTVCHWVLHFVHSTEQNS